MSNQFSEKTRIKVFNFDNRCQMCNLKLQNNDSLLPDYMQIDHLVSKKRGGINNISNLRPLCKKCNSSKRDRNSIDLCLKIKNDVENMFKEYQINLIRYEKKNNILEKEIFKNILQEATFNFISNINNLIKEVSND